MLFYVLILTILRFAFCVNGSVLPRDPEPQMSPVGNQGLAKRDYPANSITGYPVTGDCLEGDHYTWTNLTFDTCYSLPSNVPLSSVKITDFSEPIFLVVYEDNACDTMIMAILAATTGEDKCYGVGYEFAAFFIFPITAKSFPLLRHFANGQ